MTTRLLCGDALEQLRLLEDESVQCCITSPPYWGLRDYGTATWEGGDTACEHRPKVSPRGDRLKGLLVGSTRTVDEGTVQRNCHCGALRIDSQLGLERTPEEYVAKLVEVFREMRRVLRGDGTLFLNLGDSFFSGGTRPSQSRSDALACGNGGRGLQDSRVSDCVCSCLCGECRAALASSGSDNICPLHGRSQRPDSQRDRDTGLSGSASTPPDALPPGALASTKTRSGPPPPGLCLHCANCGACLSVLDSSSRDARLCVRNSCLNYTIVQPQVKLKPKDLVGVPWRVAFALQSDGWWLRSDIIWSKPNPMPESVTDRPTKAHEYLFLLTKSARYYYDAEAIKEPAISGDPRKPYAPGQVDGRGSGHDRGGGKVRPSVARGSFGGKTEAMAEEGRNAFRSIKDWRNRRTVWTIPTQPFPEAHFAIFPEALVEPCIAAGSKAGDTVLDPFSGSGTVGVVALRAGRDFIGIDLNPEYVEMARRRIEGTAPLFAEVGE